MTNNCEFHAFLLNPLKCEICNSIILIIMADSKLVQLTLKTISIVCTV